MTYKTYGKLRWFSEWKVDRSNFGHALEAFIFALVLTGITVLASGYTPAEAFLFWSGIMVANYWGREKRDCETGMDMPSGSPMAWLCMWWRPKNILDMAGPILVHAVAWAIYLDLFPQLRS